MKLDNYCQFTQIEMRLHKLGKILTHMQFYFEIFKLFLDKFR